MGTRCIECGRVYFFAREGSGRCASCRLGTGHLSEPASVLPRMKPRTEHQDAEATNSLLAPRLGPQRGHGLPDCRPFFAFPGFLARSSVMVEMSSDVRSLADRAQDMLITGETGTGKTAVAQILHEIGCRNGGRIATWPCSGGSVDVGEVELFGARVGRDTRAGVLESCDGGDLVLEEIAELPKPLQLRLLHYLDHHQFRRVGDSAPVSVDVRLIVTTASDLGRRVVDGTFTPGLYYRLKAAHVSLPPLRERVGDIPVLMHYFLTTTAARERIPLPEVPEDLVLRYEAYRWPGNVRELQAMTERGVVLGRLGVPPTSNNEQSSPSIHLPSGVTLPGYLEEVERKLIQDALDLAGRNQKKAAQSLGLSFRQLRYRIKTLRILGKRTGDDLPHS